MPWGWLFTVTETPRSRDTSSSSRMRPSKGRWSRVGVLQIDKQYRSRSRKTHAWKCISYMHPGDPSLSNTLYGLEILFEFRYHFILDHLGYQGSIGLVAYGKCRSMVEGTLETLCDHRLLPQKRHRHPRRPSLTLQRWTQINHIVIGHCWRGSIEDCRSFQSTLMDLGRTLFYSFLCVH